MSVSDIYARTLRPVLQCAFAFAFAMVSVRALAAESGSIAPDFELPTLSAQASSASAPVSSADRTHRNLREFRGSVVYLDFWASWCVPCLASFPWMNATQAKYGSRGLQVVTINLDKRLADAQRFLSGVPANFVTLRDEAAATPLAYAVKAMPTSVLIGRDGKILYRHAGFSAPTGKRIEAIIERALDGRP